jgi:hypothetical protein
MTPFAWVSFLNNKTSALFMTIYYILINGVVGALEMKMMK